MKGAATLLLFLAGIRLLPAAESFRLPAFPAPAVITEDGGTPTVTSPIRLLREMHRAGLRGFDRLETMDGDYALLRSDSLGILTGWLDATCGALDYDLRQARARVYDGAVFARLLEVATSLNSLQRSQRALAMPIGVLYCQRATAWGVLPADGGADAYIVFATEKGIIVYDPPTRQMIPLADFPNKTKVSQIRF